MKKLHAKASKITILAIILLIVLSLYSLSLILPLLWALLSSLKTADDFRKNLFGLPQEWMWSNFWTIFKNFKHDVPYGEGFKTVDMAEMYFNSVLYAGGCAFFATLVPCLTSYGCARFRFKFSRVIVNIVIVAMILPVVGALPSEIQIATSLGIFDSIFGMWIMKANFLGIYFFVFYGSFKVLPKSYSEAAQIDGAGNLSVLLNIMLPLVSGMFFTVFLINFINFWNDYQTPLIFLPSHPTVSYGLYLITITNINELSSTPMRLAACMIVFIPIFIVYIIFKDKLIGNISMGGLKE